MRLILIASIVLVLGQRSADAAGLRCRKYRWNAGEARYVCDGNDNELSHSEDGVILPDLSYLGEGVDDLGVCQGRCHDDSDCAGDLICIARDPTLPKVDGCGGGENLKFMNYCYYQDPSQRPPEGAMQQQVATTELGGNLMYVGEPPFTQQKLQECQGDCDSDWNCEFGFNCFKRSDDRAVPGCNGVGIYSVDYCYRPGPNELVLVMDAASNMIGQTAAKCEGSCLSDDDCDPGLACFERSNYQPVPGCRGIGAHATNYCYDPTDTAPLTGDTRADDVPTMGSPVAPVFATLTSAPVVAPTPVIPTESFIVGPPTEPPVVPTMSPTETASQAPTVATTATPTATPSLSPTTTKPSPRPSLRPTTATPTSVPSGEPSSQPSGAPTTLSPTEIPTTSPSALPSTVPTVIDSAEPSSLPSLLASNEPSVMPSSVPTVTLSSSPSAEPSALPTAAATVIEQAGGESRTDPPTASPTKVNLNGLIQGIPVDPTLMPTPGTDAPVGSAPSFVLPEELIPSIMLAQSETDVPTASPVNTDGLPPVFFLPEELVPSVLMAQSQSAAPSEAPSRGDGLPPVFSLPQINIPIVPTAVPPSSAAPSAGGDPGSDGGREIPGGSNPLVTTPTEGGFGGQQPGEGGGSSVVETNLPSDSPSTSPTPGPSMVPSDIPSSSPSESPTTLPSDIPSGTPTTPPSNIPSDLPSSSPTVGPSQFPSDIPSHSPSNTPSQTPSDIPSLSPTVVNSAAPSDVPSLAPSEKPSIGFIVPPVLQLPAIPIATPAVDDGGQDIPSESNPLVGSGTTENELPTGVPLASGENREVAPGVIPGALSSSVPSDVPSSTPTVTGSTYPSDIPSSAPTVVLSTMPSDVPSTTPSVLPSVQPSDIPSLSPTPAPSNVPSDLPSSNPTTPKIPTNPPVVGNQVIAGEGDEDDGLDLSSSDFPSTSPIVTIETTTTSPTSVSFQTGSGGGVQIPPDNSTDAGSQITVGEVAGGESRNVTTFAPTAAPSNQTLDPTAEASFCGNLTNEQRTTEILNGVSLSMAESSLVIMNRLPFQQAFQWLIDDDLFRVCPGDPNLEQRFSLGAVYFSLRGWNESAIEFLSQEDECDWGGITCNAQGAVESMCLDDFNLTGVLPDLSLMSASLKELDLDANQLSGELPSWITKLTQLEVLDLDTNALSGTIPEDISALTALRVLDLDANSIEGTIPESIGDLNELYFFQVDFNSLTGLIPTSMAALPNLEYLSAFGNDFSEPLALEFCSRNRTLSLFANCEICTIAECCTACLNV